MSLLDALEQSEYLCVGGCGTRAMFYYGLFEFLQQQSRYSHFMKRLKGCAGSSSGAIVALSVLVNADFRALSETALTLGRTHESVAPALNMHLLFDSYGIDDGDVLLECIDAHLEALGLSPQMTFASLHRLTQKELRVCATNLHTRKPIYFSHITSPFLPLRDAIYMSMTLPFIFKPKRFKGEMYLDGGMLSNVPVDAFPNEQPVVIYLNFNQSTQLTNVKEFATSVVCCTLAVQTVQLAQYTDAHPQKVFGFVTGPNTSATSDIGGSISLSGDDEYLLALRRDGFVAGFVGEHTSVQSLIALLVVLAVKAVWSDD